MANPSLYPALQDIWFLLSRKVHLLGAPHELQRWLDFLSVQGVEGRSLLNFLLRAPDSLIEGTTIFQAKKVGMCTIAYLRGVMACGAYTTGSAYGTTAIAA